VEEFKQANRELWNARTGVNARSETYDLAGFKAGHSSLHPIETAEVGDVAGKRLLHLQCHFGLDTLSWARLGAQVTGVDFSEQAIALAQSLAAELALPARFLCSDVYELPHLLDEQFDVLFTSAGVLCWLNDLPRWAQIVAHLLKPGGTFYIREFHPLAMVFENEGDITDLQVKYPYFHSPEPLRWEANGSYADPTADVHGVSYEWQHSLADVLNALLGAGLRLEFLHEFPYCSYPMFPFMEQGPDGNWHLRRYGDIVPLMFSLRAHKPG
jgi:SAM-dependent methyltransferase